MKLLGIWLPDNLVWHKRDPVIGTGLLFWRSKITLVYNAIKDNKANSLFNNSQSVSVPRMGLGKSYTGLILRSVQLNSYGQKDKDWAGEVILKGLVDDISLRHYGAWDIYQEFGDAVYITIPATIVCNVRKTIPASCTTNRVMVDGN